jgi:hypothetical protein
MTPLVESLKTQLIALSSTDESSRPSAVRACKATLLQMRAALRATRESQHNLLTLIDAKSQQVPTHHVRVRVSDCQNQKISDLVARLKSRDFPELSRALASLGRETAEDEELLQLLAEELLRREGLQRHLHQLTEERKFLENQISINQTQNRKFLAKIQALDEFLVSLKEFAPSPPPEQISDQRLALIHNPQSVGGKSSKQISALGELGLVVRVAVEEDGFVEIILHEKFPSLKITRSIRGRQAASEGTVVDPRLAEICAKETKLESRSYTEIVRSVINKLEL